MTRPFWTSICGRGSIASPTRALNSRPSTTPTSAGRASKVSPFFPPGISQQNYLLCRAASQLVYRFDGAPVNDSGLQLTTALCGTFIQGLDSDDQDVRRSEVRQSIDRIVRNDLVVGLEGRFGYNTWDDWGRLDSTSCVLLAIGGSPLASGVHYHAAAGWKWWSYDDGMIDNRNDLYAELKISGEVTNKFYVAGGLVYRIDTVRPGQTLRFRRSDGPQGGADRSVVERLYALHRGHPSDLHLG